MTDLAFFDNLIANRSNPPGSGKTRSYSPGGMLNWMSDSDGNRTDYLYDCPPQKLRPRAKASSEGVRKGFRGWAGSRIGAVLGLNLSGERALMRLHPGFSGAPRADFGRARVSVAPNGNAQAASFSSLYS